MSQSSLREHGWRLLETAIARSPDSSKQFWGIEYFGLAGIGKSHLLNEAKHLCRERGIAYAGLDFLVAAESSSRLCPVSLLVQLCEQLDHYVSTFRARQHLTRNKGDSDVSAFVGRLAQDLRGQPFILLFDSLECCSEDVFNWLGKELLTPLTEDETLPGLLGVFLAGRGPRVATSEWPKVLRQKTESIQLDPLDFEATEELLGDLPPAGIYRTSAKDIYALSNGHPYSTQAIAYWLSTLGIQPPQVASKREVLARRLHKEVIRQYILADAGDWVLPFIEVACVARRFDAATLMKLVGAYRPGLAPNQSVQWYIHRINDLLARPLHLIYLNPNGSTYHPDPTLRKLLHTALAILNPAEMVAMHRSMLTFWEGSLADERTSPAGAVQEIIYHAAQVALVDGGNTQQAVRAAKETLGTQLSAHFQIAQPRDLEQLILLQNLLIADIELNDMLRPAGVQSLREQVDAFIRPPTRSIYDFAFTHLVMEYTPPSAYRVSWYKDNDVVVPTERLSSGRQYSLTDWRAHPEEIGRTAFRLYLPLRAQEFMRSQRDWAIQISTDWTDMPWELLHDGTEFLCLSRPIARRPRMLKEPRKHQREPSAPLRALVIGDPQDNLPGAADEARTIGQLLAEKGVVVDLLVGAREASANEFSIRLASKAHYDLIHYAGHGYFDENTPHHSGLLFADGAILAEELERGLNSQAFVFLNTCGGGRSQASKSVAGFQGRFIEGLATSVLLGGASGCLAPMWDIKGSVSKDFALAFYREVLAMQPLGEAVRRARAAVRGQSPDHWATWILYGNPLEMLYSLSVEELKFRRATQDYGEAAFSLAQAIERKQEEPFREAVGKFLKYLEEYVNLQVEQSDSKAHYIKDGETNTPCVIAFARRPPWQLALPERLPLVFPCLDQLSSVHFPQLPFVLMEAGTILGQLALIFVNKSSYGHKETVRQPQPEIEFREVKPTGTDQSLLDTLGRLVADRTDWTTTALYDPRTPIRTPERYFGRKEEINAILTHLGERNHYLVGGRRSGKTSTIYVVQSYLERSNSRDPRLLSMMMQSVKNYEDLRKKLRRSTPLEIPEGDVAAGLLDAVKQYSAKCNGAKVILAWDEVDNLLDFDAKQGWHLFSALRDEADSARPTLKLLLAGFPILYRSLHDGNSPFFNFGREVIVRRLRRDEALELISRPMRALGLSIDEGFADIIFDFSAGHPSLIQNVCYELTQSMLAHSQVKATREIVEEVLNSKDVNTFYYETVYNTSLPALTRLVVLIAIKLLSFGEKEMVEAVRGHCPKVGIAPIRESLDLLETYLLARQDQHYRLAMPAFPAVFARKYSIALEIQEVVKELSRAR